MKKHIFAAVMLLSSWASAEAPPLRKSQIPRGSTILLIGDSLGVGLGPHFKSLAKIAGYQSVVHAIGGTTTWQWSTGLIKTTLKLYKPSLVIVSLGTNDSNLNIGWVREHSGVYAQIVSTIESTGAEVVWIGLPDLPKDRLPHADEVCIMIQSTGVTYYDSRDFSMPQPDGIHSTFNGYKGWMTDVWDWMTQRDIVDK